MARSKSRTRTAVSKSPARAGKKATPKTEPKKSAAPKRTPSRSRSASRGRGRPRKDAAKTPAKSPAKTPKKAASKSPARSASRSRATAAKSPAVAKTPSVVKTPAKTPSTKQVVPRAGRSTERRRPIETPALRILRNDSASRSPVKAVNNKKSKCPWYPNWVCEYGKSGCAAFKQHRRDIIISFFLIVFIAAMVYCIVNHDPAKIRSQLVAVPSRVQAWAKSVMDKIRK